MKFEIKTAVLLKSINLVLLVAILGLLVWSKPWSDTSTTKPVRTIVVTGEATLEAEPDQYTFSPYFQQSGTDRDALKEELLIKANDAVTKLKEIGVEEKHITLDASSYDRWYWNEDSDEKGQMTVSLSIRVNEKDLAQQVQDHLATLDIKGQITSHAVFSKAKQKELDTEATAIASEDARTKAEAQAKLFGSELGDVVTVTNGSDGIYAMDLMSREDTAMESVTMEGSASAMSIPVLSGVNEFNQSVTVKYELK